MLPTSRGDIFHLLKALGIEIHPKTTLPTATLEKRLRKALDSAQYITDAIDTPEDSDGKLTLDVRKMKPWSRGNVYSASQRGSLGEAMINYATQNTVPELYVNALTDLRQTVMSMGAYFDKGCTLFCLQDQKKEESAITIRVIEVLEKHEKVPVFMVLYVHGTKENPQGVDWVQYQVQSGTANALVGVTCTMMEQQLLLRILDVNSKRIPAHYKPRRGPREQNFTPSFILPVGPLESKDLGRLNINNGCVVCGKPADKRCAGCAGGFQENVRSFSKPTLYLYWLSVAIHYCSPECQKADWPDHKSTCKTLMNAKWTFVRFYIIPPGLPPGASYTVLNHNDRVSGRPDRPLEVKSEETEAPLNTHGTKPFIVKVQYNGSDATPMMIYDRRRTFHVLYPKSREDVNEAENYDNVARAVRSNIAWSGAKLFCWARRTGEWQLDLALDKLPSQDVKW
ncbi:hypothetical protein FRB96_001998 [Tulasnella sp. 330]|nr:hypothetical protein FRB96_001998 [Tulasnella sp. 330]